MAQPLTFEAASVKPNRSGSNSAHTHSSGANLEMTNVPLAECIRQAYGLKPEQMSGPNWLESERVDIIAKAARPMTGQELMQMMQSLLVERFKLASHFGGTAVARLSACRWTRSCGWIQPVTGNAGESWSRDNGKTSTATEVTMAQFGRFLTRIVGAPVVDQTNVSGSLYPRSHSLHSGKSSPMPSGPTADPPAGPARPRSCDAVRDFWLKLELGASCRCRF